MGILYYDRGGAKSSIDRIQDNAVNNWNVARVFGIDDVIDVILLSSDPEALSVLPLQFEKIANEIGTHGSQKLIDNIYWCKNEADHPIDNPRFSRGRVNELNRMLNQTQTGWAESDSSHQRPIKGRPQFWHTQEFHPNNKKQVIWENDGKCTQFSFLYNDPAPISELMLYGYQLPNPSQFTHRSNWLQFASSNSRSGHYLIFILTTTRLLKQLRFSKNSPAQGTLSSLISKARQKETVKSLARSICSTSPIRSSDMAIFNAGRYYMGDAIYSDNGQYKFLIQADGNLVTYDISNSDPRAVWSTNTNSVKYMRPQLLVKGNGSLSVLDENGGNEFQFANVNLSGGGYLMLANSGDLVVRAKDTHALAWVSRTIPVENQRHIYNDYFNGSAFYFAYEKEYPPGSAIYSPNLSYKLIFQPDGNFVLWDMINGGALWQTATINKGATKLKIQKDGNVVISNAKGEALWNTVTFGWNCRVFLAVDNKGFAILFAKPQGTNAVVAWWAPRDFHWAEVYAGGGRTIRDRAVYVETNNENVMTIPRLEQAMMDSSICGSTEFKDTVDPNARLRVRADYCMQGYNVMLDKTTCSIFSTAIDSKVDPNGIIKGDVDAYVKSKICNKAFETRFEESPNLGTLVKEFCSCVNLAGTSKEFEGNKVAPICYVDSCINSGYKSAENLAAKGTCPPCMCSNRINASNVTMKEVQQTCPVNCTNIATGDKTVAQTTQAETNTVLGKDGQPIASTSKTSESTTSDTAGAKTQASSSAEQTTKAPDSLDVSKVPVVSTTKQTIDPRITYGVMGLLGLLGLLIIAFILSSMFKKKQQPQMPFMPPYGMMPSY